MTMTDQESATDLKCRYRYANGCAATYDKRTGLNYHEKTSATHALHRIELRDCPLPECDASFADEAGRSQHLGDEHAIRAGSELRQELDAQQVKELWDASRPAVAAAAVPMPPFTPTAPASPETAANGHAHSPAPSPNGHPATNGHSPAGLDLVAAQGTFAALIAEVEALRAAPQALLAEIRELKAENAELKAEAATIAQIRTILAGQDKVTGLASSRLTGQGTGSACGWVLSQGETCLSLGPGLSCEVAASCSSRGPLRFSWRATAGRPSP